MTISYFYKDVYDKGGLQKMVSKGWCKESRSSVTLLWLRLYTQLWSYICVLVKTISETILWSPVSGYRS